MPESLSAGCALGPTRGWLAYRDGEPVFLPGTDFGGAALHWATVEAYREILRGGEAWTGYVAIDLEPSPGAAPLALGPHGPTLIPGLEDLRPPPSEPALAWREALPIAAWRGPLAGQAHSLTEVFRCPRVRLCLASRYFERLDARLTSLGGFEEYGHVLRDALVGLRILTDAEPPGPCRYVIDIEGDPSDRGALRGMLRNQCVIRVGSPAPVWFEHLLIPGETLACVDHPSATPDMVRRLDASGQGEAIRARSAALADMLTPEFAASRLLERLHAAVQANPLG